MEKLKSLDDLKGDVKPGDLVRLVFKSGGDYEGHFKGSHEKHPIHFFVDSYPPSEYSKEMALNNQGMFRESHSYKKGSKVLNYIIVKRYKNNG